MLEVNVPGVLFDGLDQSLHSLSKQAVWEGRLEILHAVFHHIKQDSLLDGWKVNIANSTKEQLLKVVNGPWRQCEKASNVASPFHLALLAWHFYNEMFTEDKMPLHVKSSQELQIELFKHLTELPANLLKEIYQTLKTNLCLVTDGSQPLNVASSSLKTYFETSSDSFSLYVMGLFSREHALCESDAALIDLIWTKQLLSIIRNFKGDCSTGICDGRNYLEKIQVIVKLNEGDGEAWIAAVETLAELSNLYPDFCMTADCYQSLMKVDAPAAVAAFLHKEFELNHHQEFSVDALGSDIGSCRGVVPATVAAIVKVLVESGKECDWKHLFSLCHFMKIHFVEALTVAALLFCETGFPAKAMELLSARPIEKLKPLILLAAWPNCKSLAEARALLGSLWQVEKPPKDMHLLQACECLAYETKLVSWCLKQTKHLSLSQQKTFQDNVAVMFHQLESQSALYVLNYAKFILHLPHDEVLELLKTQPAVQSYSVARRSYVQQDLDVYISYYVLKTFLNVMVLTNASYNYLLCNSSLYKTFHESCESTEQSAIYRHLNHIEQQLSSIEDMHVRIDVLESLLGMMFLRGCDLVDKELETDLVEEPTRSLHSSISSSMESFYILDDESEQLQLSPMKDVTSPSCSTPKDVSLHAKLHRHYPASLSSTLLFTSSAEDCPDIDNDVTPTNVFHDTITAVNTGVVPGSSCAAEDEDVKYPGKDVELYELVSSNVLDSSFLVHHSTLGVMLQFLGSIAEKMLSSVTDCDDAHEDYLRVSKVVQVIREAQWRHQLVQVAMSRAGDEAKMPKNREVPVLSDQSSGSEESIPTSPCATHPEKKHVQFSQKQSKAAVPLTKSPRASSISMDREDSGTLSGHSIMSLMLATPQSLVYVSLKTCGTSEAGQIIKMFDLGGTPLSDEVDFVDQINNSLSSLQSVYSPEQVSQPSQSEQHLSFAGSFPSIQSAAAAGKVSASVSSVVDGVLGHQGLSHFAKTLSRPNVLLVHVAVMMDLMVNSNLNVMPCASILDSVAVKLDKAESLSGVVESFANVSALVSNMTSFVNMQIKLSNEKTCASSICDCFGILLRPDLNFPLELESYGPQSLAYGRFETLVCSSLVTDKLQLLEAQNPSKMVQAEMQILRSGITDDWRVHVKRSVIKDYVGVLFKHVSTLATLQLYYKHKQPSEEAVSTIQNLGSALQAVNPFVVLKEEISLTFGRLLFEWNMSPKRLESVAKQVNINLVKVIAKNCGVHITPKVDFKSQMAVYKLLYRQHPVILNAAEAKSSPYTRWEEDPATVVEQLLETLIDLLKGSPSLTQLASSPGFVEYQASVSLLAVVDLAILTTEELKLAFYINVFNLMFAHGMILFLSGKLVDLSDDEKLSPEEELYELLMSSPAGRLGIFNSIAYQIGQVGTVSAYDLHQHILLGGAATTLFGKSFGGATHTFSWTSNLLKYCPQNTNKSSCFALCLGCPSFPGLQIVYGKGLGLKLNTMCEDFLDSNVFVDESSLKITIPELLMCHFTLLTSRKALSSTSHSSSLDHQDDVVGLLKCLTDADCSPKLYSTLLKIEPELYTVTVSKTNWSVNYIPKPAARSLHYLNLKEFIIESRNPEVQAMDYHIAEPISKYVQETSPSAAAVIHMSFAAKSLAGHLKIKLLAPLSESNVVSSLGGFMQRGLQSLISSDGEFFALHNLLHHNETILFAFLNAIECCMMEHGVKGNKTVNYGMQLLSDNCFFRNLDANWSVFLPTYLNYLVDDAFSARAVYAIRNLLFSFPGHLRDVLLVESVNHAVALREKAFFHSSELQQLLLMIADGDARAELLLEHYAVFSENELSVLFTVSMETCLSIELREKLQCSCEEVKWCSKVSKISNSFFSKRDPASEVVTSWQDVSALLHEQPDYLVVFLISTRSFDVVDQWIQNYVMDDRLQKACIQAKLQFLLATESNLLLIHRHLDDIPNRQMAYEICLTLVSDYTMAVEKSLFMLRYMVDNFKHQVSDHQLNALLLDLIGFEILNLLPDEMHSNYISLKSHPVLIVEQLIMNLKIDWAGTVVRYLRNVMIQSSGCHEILARLLVDVDDIVAKFSSKALKMKCSAPYPDEDLDTANDDKAGQSPSKGNHKRNVSTVSSSSQNDVPTAVVVTTEASCSGSTSAGTDDDAIAAQFPITTHPRSRRNWIEDGLIETCMVCNLEGFGMFNRRHHCRHCGYVVCARCSKHLCPVRGYARPVRTCDKCYASFYSQLKLARPQVSQSQLACETVSIPVSGVIGVGPSSRSVDTDDIFERSTLSITEWLLSDDYENNVRMEKEFYFEQAPSASLCLAILDMYGSSKACGGLLLKFCNELSHFLSPNSSNQRSTKDEIDVHMIVRIIEFLLFNAKVVFTKAGDSKGAESCDTYLAHAEILKLLLDDNWSDIPTMQQLSQPEATRRLRDRLIDEERFALAIEITGKCGMDPSTVWFLMGMSKLKCGDFIDAREQFSKCMTATRMDGSKPLQSTVHYLDSILSVLESSPLLSFEVQGDGLDFILTSLQEHAKNPDTGCTIDKLRFAESMHYLSTYGSYTQLMAYHVRHGLLLKACWAAKETNCPPDVFLDLVVLPSFQEGNFSSLAEALLSVDSTLRFWTPFLGFCCQQLSRRGLFHCLYELQLFTKDYFRASMTCVKFFLGVFGNGALSYTELHGRLHYLKVAKKHIEDLLAEKTIVTSGFISHASSSFANGERTKRFISDDLPVSDLKMHLSTVDLQIRVTEYQYSKEKTTRKWRDETTYQIPTLFGKGKERADVVVELLLKGAEDSFSLASRVMQDYSLPCLPIFVKAATQLASKKDFSSLGDLIRIVEEIGMVSSRERDDLLLKIIKEISKLPNQTKQAQLFIKKIKGNTAKVNAHLYCGKLRDAYLEAVKHEKAGDIQHILTEAERTDQKNIAEICRKWLRGFKDRQEQRRMHQNAD